MGSTARSGGLLAVALGLATVLAVLGCAPPEDAPQGSASPQSSLGVLQSSSLIDASAVDPAGPGGPAEGEATVLPPVTLRPRRAEVTTTAAAGVTPSGLAVVTLRDDRSELCVRIAVAGLSQPTAAHLHDAPTEGPGEVVLALKAPPTGDGEVDACVSASARVLDRIRRSPDRFAITVHTETAPDGALRGQLH